MRDTFQPFAQGKPQERPRWLLLANNEPPDEIIQAMQPTAGDDMFLYNPEYDLETQRREDQATVVEGCLYGLFAACCCCMLFDMLT